MGDPVPVYKVVSVLIVAAASFIAVRRYGLERPGAPLLAAVMVAPGMLLWAVAGLETPILMGIVTTMATVFASGSPGDSRAVVTLGFLAGAAVPTRYDAVLFAGPMLLAASRRQTNDRTTAYGAHMPITSMLSRVTEARLGSCRRSSCAMCS